MTNEHFTEIFINKSAATETEERILNTSQDLVYKYGIKSVTMDDIARQAGISKKTIYAYFSDKDSLIVSLADRNISGHKAVFAEIAKSSENAIHEIIELLKYLGIMFSVMNPVLFFDMQRYHPSAWQLLNNFINDFIFKLFMNNLEKGIRERLYRKEINTEIIARIRINEVMTAFDASFFPIEKFSFLELQVELMDYYLHGITSLKGRKLINKYKQIPEEEDK